MPRFKPWNSGDSGVVGRSVQIGQLVYTVVGVAPPAFRGLGAGVPDAWWPTLRAARLDPARVLRED